MEIDRVGVRRYGLKSRRVIKALPVSIDRESFGRFCSRAARYRVDR